MTDDLPRSRPAVRATYERIGEHFAKTRVHPWPEVEAFCRDRVGAVGLDIGCGNGRHTGLLAETAGTVVALDVSRSLLRETAGRMTDGGWTAAPVQGDAAEIPLKAGTVDVCLSVATLHHLPTQECRVDSLREVGRVLGASGTALISAWSTAHDRFDAPTEAAVGFDTTVDWTLPDGEKVPRFYHIYALPEFKADLEAAGLTVETVYQSSGNCFGVVRP